MMIHEKLMSGQFLFDFKNDHTNLLHGPTHLQHQALQHHHHHHNLHQHQHHHQQLPSPPMPGVKMDLYSAYAYRQHLQQQLLANEPEQFPQHNPSPPAEVLDLSRRCDSVETPRKTPSPYQTNSSYGTGSPATSPSTKQPQQKQQQKDSCGPASLTQSDLLCSPNAQRNQSPMGVGLAGLYPNLYYANSAGLKQDTLSTTPPLPAPVHSPLSNPIKVSSPSLPAQLPVAATSLLQTFASAAAVVAKNLDPATEAQTNVSSTTSLTAQSPALATTPPNAPIVSTISTLDGKPTRPFKAFPRDPLVIAANFAATDVLLDNPRVERYTEYRKRVLEQIRNSNGGSRTVTNPKMRRTNSRSGSVNDGCCSNNNSEGEDRHGIDESSDCDSTAGNFEKLHNTTSDSTDHNANSSSSKDNNQTGNISTSGPVKDAAYYERRRKNNAAAKKSRDRRRIKEDEIAIRAAYLERQNIELLCQIDALKAQLAAFTSKVGA